MTNHNNTLELKIPSRVVLHAPHLNDVECDPRRKKWKSNNEHSIKNNDQHFLVICCHSTTDILKKVHSSSSTECHHPRLVSLSKKLHFEDIIAANALITCVHVIAAVHCWTLNIVPIRQRIGFPPSYHCYVMSKSKPGCSICRSRG